MNAKRASKGSNKELYTKVIPSNVAVHFSFVRGETSNSSAMSLLSILHQGGSEGGIDGGAGGGVGGGTGGGIRAGMGKESERNSFVAGSK